MTVSQVCDLAYVLMREDIVAQVQAVRLAWAMSGDQKATMPTLSDAVEALDKALEHDATAGLTASELDLREYLGVLGAR